jgi:hypothetical protein
MKSEALKTSDAVLAQHQHVAPSLRIAIEARRSFEAIASLDASIPVLLDDCFLTFIA